MAVTVGQVYQTNNSNEGNNYGSTTYILKDDVKKDWYLYRLSAGGVVRPYAVYDQAGFPCPPISTAEGDNPHSILPAAFAIVPTATFAGLKGDLGFIDWCIDLDRYSADGSTPRTPYWYLIRALRTMLPARDSHQTNSGLPTPQALKVAQMNIMYSKTTVLFRGAVLRHRGKPSTAKKAVDGIMFNSVYYIPATSAVNAFIRELNKPKVPHNPVVSPDNCYCGDMFELTGIAFEFGKVGPNSSDDYTCTVTFDQNYATSAAKAFCLPDPSAYHAAVRASFGNYQSIDSILNVMTVADMISVLRQGFPPAYLYYGLKDSPFSEFLTQEDRMAALNDPEVAMWLGVDQGLQRSPYNQPTTPAASPAPQTSAYPQAAAYPQPTTQYAAGTPPKSMEAPSWVSHNTATMMNTPMSPAQPTNTAAAVGYPQVSPEIPAPQPAYGNAATVSAQDDLPPMTPEERAQFNRWQSIYGSDSAAQNNEPDGIRM
jgi:hypothetical protein